VEALLLVAIIAIDGDRIDRRSAVGRALSLGLVAVLAADAAGVTGRLIVDLVEGGPETNSATDLLKTGFLVWFTRSSLFPSSTGYLTEVVQNRVSWLRRNSQTSPSPSSSTRR
jgi:hypothetical protein